MSGGETGGMAAVTHPLLGEWLTDQPFSLALSSGYFGFFAHFGLLTALSEASIHPVTISGSSSGALAAAFWASGCDPAEIRTLLFSLDRKQIWDPGIGAGLLRGDRFRALVRKHSPVENLEQCRIPVRISAFDLLTRSTRVLDRGNLGNAVYASCCVPFLFQPIRIGNAVYIDGGIGDQDGLAGVKPGGRLLHHYIPSRLPLGDRLPKHARNRHPGERLTVILRQQITVGLSKLDNGPAAYQAARQTMLEALERPLDTSLCLL